MKLKNVFAISLMLVLFFLSFVSKVYAVDETGKVNLLDLPQKLADALGIPLFAAQILTCLIFLFIFLLPIAIFCKRNPTIIAIIVCVPLLGFFVAVGWLSYWVLLVIVLILAAMYSGKIKEWIT